MSKLVSATRLDGLKSLAGPLPIGKITAAYFLNSCFQVSTMTLLDLWAFLKK
ncbi:hypothetical protein IJQ19_03915 [bacterium]|nr:hypothetical protein [bacterium]